MKIISWNCQGAFRKKAGYILPQRPDILVVQECEHPGKLIFSPMAQPPNEFLWFGDNKHKGLGIFSYGHYKFQLLEQYNEDIKIISPISVTGGKFDFTLFAIWANNRNDKDGQYVEQIWKAINYYDQILDSGEIILTGDFNSNKIWDKQHRMGNHSDVVERLAAKNIFSVYHKHLKQEQGKENHPTFFLQRKKNKPYHIDYFFASANLIDKIENFKIGTYKKWIAHSDHTPIIATFNFVKETTAKTNEITLTKIVNPKDIKKLLTKDNIISLLHTRYGAPPNWNRPQGFISLSKVILEQQVSLASAKAHFLKLNNYLKAFTPLNILKLSDNEMRNCQISCQKAKYLRALSNAIINGEINLENLSELNEQEIRKQLTAIKGIGDWTTDIYLMFCLQAKDIFPIGDIAIVNTVKELYGANTKEEISLIAEKWKPFRSLAAYFLWHYYLNKRNRAPADADISNSSISPAGPGMQTGKV